MGKLNEEIRPVEADGIQEYDNQLPAWWVGLFIICVIIGVLYGLDMHFWGGESQIDTHNREQIALEQIQAKKVAAESDATAGDGESLLASLTSADFSGPGKAIYETNCAACHGMDGGGAIGPNLTDAHWINGGSPEEVYKSVSAGIPTKGMMAWASVLGKQKVLQVSAYVLILKGTTPANPKAPEGKKID